MLLRHTEIKGAFGEGASTVQGSWGRPEQGSRERRRRLSLEPCNPQGEPRRIRT